jgi:hypothetical protein
LGAPIGRPNRPSREREVKKKNSLRGFWGVRPSGASPDPRIGPLGRGGDFTVVFAEIVKIESMVFIETHLPYFFILEKLKQIIQSLLGLLNQIHNIILKLKPTKAMMLINMNLEWGKSNICIINL